MNFFRWYLILFLAGLVFWPGLSLIFRKFRDAGYMTVKFLGLFFGGWALWALNCARLVKFTVRGCVAVLVVLALLSCAAFAYAKIKKPDLLPKLNIPLILAEEAVFLLLLAVWYYVIGFKPDAYGTEKFMDYAFLTAMTRSLWMPFPDPWFAGKAINYYYGGQFMAAYLVRLSGVPCGVGYNLMRATVAAGSFSLPFSLIHTMLAEYLEARRIRRGIWPVLGGTLAGIATGYAGNGHYIIYRFIKPLVETLRGQAPTYYWFPDSTRYIGYDPDLPDKTIHEFPAYSSVLGDLHAHYVNLIFVIAVTAVAVAWAMNVYTKRQETRPVTESVRPFWKEVLFEGVLRPEILLIAVMTGAFRWTNFWDFPIYVVVCGAVVMFTDLRIYKGDGKRFLAVLASQTATVFLAGYLAALPFTATFDQISTEIHPTTSHTLFYQLIILWGLPVAVSLGYIISLAVPALRRAIADRAAEKKDVREDEVRKEAREDKPREDEAAAPDVMKLPDLLILLFVLCAMGLVLLPEIIYVKDIYTGGHYRANTMFKLTYQAFILFGISMGYILIRALADRIGTAEPEPVKAPQKKRGAAAKGSAKTADPQIQPAAPSLRPFGIGGALAIIAIVLVLWTGGYTIHSIHAWFGDVTKKEERISSDASVFISRYFADDFGAVCWLNENVRGNANILEAPGDSYSGYERITSATGLATPLGWYVHEWLWRGGTEQLNVRSADVEAAYTSDDPSYVEQILKKYRIAYVYIGTLEREKYEVNDAVLESLGDVVYKDDTAKIIKTLLR